MLVRQLKEFVAGRNISLTKAKDMLEKLGARADKNCCVDGVVHGRGYLGVKMLTAEEDHLD